jgi:hypothetical protein
MRRLGEERADIADGPGLEGLQTKVAQMKSLQAQIPDAKAKQGRTRHHRLHGDHRLPLIGYDQALNPQCDQSLES